MKILSDLSFFMITYHDTQNQSSLDTIAVQIIWRQYLNVLRRYLHNSMTPQTHPIPFRRASSDDPSTPRKIPQETSDTPINPDTPVWSKSLDSNTFFFEEK